MKPVVRDDNEFENRGKSMVEPPCECSVLPGFKCKDANRQHLSRLTCG